MQSENKKTISYKLKTPAMQLPRVVYIPDHLDITIEDDRVEAGIICAEDYNRTFGRNVEWPVVFEMSTVKFLDEDCRQGMSIHVSVMVDMFVQFCAKAI